MAGMRAKMNRQTNSSGRTSMSSIASNIACRLVSSSANAREKSPRGRCLKKAVDRATRGIMPRARRVEPRSFLPLSFWVYPPIWLGLYWAIRVMSSAGMAMKAVNCSKLPQRNTLIPKAEREGWFSSCEV